MIGIKKPFSKSLHRSNDPKSRRVVKEYLKRNGIEVEDNPNKFGVDLISKDGTLQIEIEHRLVWTSEEFNFDTVNLPERKARYFTSNNVAYLILSCDYSRMGMVDGKTLRHYIVDENLKESSNKYVRRGEFFYKIPRDAFKWIKL
jgi:hypothetical protein